MNVETLEIMTRWLCSLNTDQVFDYLGTLGFDVIHPRSKTKRYAIRPGSTNDRPLLVCHADTVLGSSAYQYDPQTSVVVSSELDDRLGIAIMLCLLSEGVDVACLVCDNEEIGATTATQFVRETDLTPVWLTEFDRRGVDVVCYEYETPILCSLLEHVGFTVGTGSFSDISSMERLDVIGFNVGVAYHREHSLLCHANLNQTIGQVERWLLWFNWLHSVRLSHEHSSWSVRSKSYNSIRYTSTTIVDSPILDNPADVDTLWDDWKDEGFELCDQCGNYCDINTMCDFSGGSVCENCICHLRGAKI